MTNRITVEAQQDGTQIWNSVDLETGEELRYLLTPVSALHAGDRLADVQVFRRRASSNALDKVTLTGQGVLSQNDINQLPAGSFVRLGPHPARVQSQAKLEGG